jgi:hypothetical protein
MAEAIPMSACQLLKPSNPWVGFQSVTICKAPSRTVQRTSGHTGCRAGLRDGGDREQQDGAIGP